MGNAFTPLQYTWLSAGAVLLIAAVILFLRGKTLWSLGILTLAGFTLRMLMVSTDPFLYDWDEQYHALVAKNMIAHPGTPVLYDEPLLPFDMTNWSRNHIWLHKPPLFLWLIAISVKIFGATPFAVKLPSILLSSLMIPAVYFMMKRLFSEKAGWIAALLLAAHSYSIQLVSGFRNTDHNDVMFSAFLLFTFWAWVKYTDTRLKRHALLTGVLVGCAVLVKWLPGILVFLPWGLWLLGRSQRGERKLWLHFMLAITAAMVMVLPWYTRIFLYFPAEAAYEMHYNALHFTIAIEGHEGPWYYHFDAIRELMGWTLAILSVFGLFLFATRGSRHRGLYIVIAVLFFFTFYTLAKTKMPLFMLPIVPFLLGGIALLLERGLAFLGSRRMIAGLVMSAISIFLLDPVNLIINHSSMSELAWYRDEMRNTRTHAEEFIRAKDTAGDNSQRWVIFNYPDNSRAAFMFYTGDIAYNQSPGLDTVQTITSKGFHAAAIDNQFLPDAYRSSPLVKLVKEVPR